MMAGASIIETATYQASTEGFMEHLGMTEKGACEMITEGANLAVEARDEFWEKHGGTEIVKPLVAASVGPYGACLHDGSEYTGKYVDTMSTGDLVKWHRPKVGALLKADVDFIAFETIPAQKEAEAIIRLLQEFPSAKAWISYSCSDSSHTSYGNNFVDAVQCISASEQILGIGINCTPPGYIDGLLDEIPVVIKQTKKIIIYPNSGEEWVSHKWVGGDTCKKLYEYAPSWIEKGAHWIGGCCRINCTDIHDIKQTIKDTTNQVRNT